MRGTVEICHGDPLEMHVEYSVRSDEGPVMLLLGRSLQPIGNEGDAPFIVMAQ
jgi:hypothetical protein